MYQAFREQQLQYRQAHLLAQDGQAKTTDTGNGTWEDGQAKTTDTGNGTWEDGQAKTTDTGNGTWEDGNSIKEEGVNNLQCKEDDVNKPCVDNESPHESQSAHLKMTGIRTLRTPHVYKRMDGNSTTRSCNSQMPNDSVHLRVLTASKLHVMSDPAVYKGRAFSLKERQLLGIHGLLPPSILTQDQQVFIVMQNFYRWDSDLDRYIYLMGLQDRNEKLFYRVIAENVELMMPVIYTPTVGLACQKYGLIFRKPRGLFITIQDKGHIYEILCNWPEQDVKAVVVTDGERILGLGDLGAYGMGIPVGKLALYTACAGVKPHTCLPITLDVGTNRESLIKDPLYIGLRQKRTTGAVYDEFIDEFMAAIVRRYGQNTLIQFEDFGNHNAFRFLEKYRNMYCTFNDDIQGTAAVTVAGMMSCMKLTEKRMCDNVFLFQGAGEAAIGIANLLVMSMEEDGLETEDAVKRIWMVDSKGLIVKDRPAGGITIQKERFCQDHAPVNSLEEAVASIKPTAIIGVAAVAGAFTERIIRDMARFNERPIIFALSNPTSKAECTAEQAYTFTEGRCIFASGSPFNPVKINGKTFYPGQGNNAYIFPGVALGITLCGVRHIPEGIFLRAAEVLASLVTKEDLDEGRVYPSLAKILQVSILIAIKVATYVYELKLASHYPEPADKAQFVRSHLYETEYESFIPDTYEWPESTM